MTYRVRLKLAAAFTSLFMLQGSAFPQASELPTINEFMEETVVTYYAGLVMERDCRDSLPYGLKPSFASKEFFRVMKEFGMKDEKKVAEVASIVKNKVASNAIPDLDLLKGSKSGFDRKYLCRSAIDRALFRFERLGEIGRQFHELFLKSRDEGRESDKKIGIVVGRDVDVILFKSK